MARQGEKAPMNSRTKMYMVLLLCCVMLLISVGIALFFVHGFGSTEEEPQTVDSEPMVVESGYDKDEHTIDSTQFDATILPQTDDAGQEYIDETLFLGDSNTARMYRMFDYCSYDNAIGSVGMTARSLPSFACVKFSGYSSYVTMPEAVALMQPRRVILTFGTNDLDPNLSAAQFIEKYQAGIEAVEAAYPSVDIIINSIPPLGQQHSNQSLTQAQVDEFNKAIVEMCQAKGWKFLNSAETLKDASTGYAKSGYVESSDGIHLTRAAMEALFEYIRTHSYITEDDRPALTAAPTHVEDKDAVSYSVPVVSASPTQAPASEAESTETPGEPAEPTPEPETVLVRSEERAATCTENGGILDFYQRGDETWQSWREGTWVDPLGHDFSDNAEYCRHNCGTKNPDYQAPAATPEPTPEVPAEPSATETPAESTSTESTPAETADTSAVEDTAPAQDSAEGQSEGE